MTRVFVSCTRHMGLLTHGGLWSNCFLSGGKCLSEGGIRFVFDTFFRGRGLMRIDKFNLCWYEDYSQANVKAIFDGPSIPQFVERIFWVHKIQGYTISEEKTTAKNLTFPGSCAEFGEENALLCSVQLLAHACMLPFMSNMLQFVAKDKQKNHIHALQNGCQITRDYSHTRAVLLKFSFCSD